MKPEAPVMPDETRQPPKVKGTCVEDSTITEGSVTYDIRFDAVAQEDGCLISLILFLQDLEIWRCGTAGRGIEQSIMVSAFY